MKKLSLFIAVLLVVSMFPFTVLAADDNGDGYNDHDVSLISAFLNQESGGTTNAEKLGYADAGDPAAWTSGITWSVVEGEQRVKSIDWSYSDLSGKLDLSGCISLTELYCPSCGLSSLDVNGCESLSTLSCEFNSLSSLDVSGCIALGQLYCEQNSIETLDVSGCSNLTWLSCSNNNLTELDVSGCTNLSGLMCHNNRLSLLDVSGCPLGYFMCDGNPLKSIHAVIEGNDIIVSTYDGFVKLAYLSYDDGGVKYVERFGAGATPDSLPFSAWTGTKDGESFSADSSNIELEPGFDYNIVADFASSAVYNDHDVVKMQKYLNQEPLEGSNYYQLGYNADDPSTWSDITWEASPDGLRIKSVEWNEGQNVGGILNLSGCTYLETLVLKENEISGLDLSGCTALKTLSCEKLCLGDIDLDGCGGLESIKLNDNYEAISELNLHGYAELKHLECTGSNIEELNLDGCTALEYLDCSNNLIDTLDVSDCTGLTVISCAGNTLTRIISVINGSEIDLKAAGPGQVELSYNGGSRAYAHAVSDSSVFYNWSYVNNGEQRSNNALVTLYLNEEENNKLVANFVPDIVYNEYDVEKIQDFLAQGSNAQNLGYDVNDPATWTDINWGTAGDELRVTMISWYDRDIAGPLELSGCTSLKCINCDENSIGALDVSGCTSLAILYCNNSGLESLDVSECDALDELYCANNSLSSLDVSDCASLSELSCENNPFESLDVSGLENLKWLYCNDNELTSLNISGCKELYGLYCAHNALAELDLSDCIKLGALDCRFNNMNSLDISGLPISYITCSDNPMEHIGANLEGKDVTLAADGGYVSLNYNAYYEDGIKYLEEFSATAAPDSLPFTGWTGTRDEAPFSSETVKIDLTPGAGYNLTAYFGYAVTYDSNGADEGNVPEGGRYAVGANIAVSGNTGNLVRTGYGLSGWNTEASGSGISYDEGDTLIMAEADVTLYAQWTPVIYSISYDLDGGMADNPAVYTAETLSFTLENPIKQGYVFTGWTGTGLTEPAMAVTIAKGSTGDRSYTARWQADVVTVTFDAQGGSEVGNIRINSGDTIDASPITTKFGYNFTGWFSEQGSAITFPYTVTADTTLSAGWEEQPQTAYLADVKLSSGSLNKEFSKTAFCYLIDIGEDDEEFTLTPIKEYDGASMKINGKSVSSHTVSPDCGRFAKITVKVKLGQVRTTYTFVVIRAKSTNADLKLLKTSVGITPDFSPDVTSYAADMPANKKWAKITANAAGLGADVSIDGAAGSTKKIYLSRGESKTVRIVVTSQAGTTKEYQIIVTRP